MDVSATKTSPPTNTGALRSTGAALGNIADLGYGASYVALFVTGVIPLHKITLAAANVHEAIGRALGFEKTWQRSIPLAIATAIAVGTLVTPVDASQHQGLFMRAKGVTAESFHAACRAGNKLDPRITDGRSTAALMVARHMEPNQNGYTVERIRQLAALQGLNHGILPLALYMLQQIESAGGKDVATTASSAEGLYQSLTSTTLDWLARHYKEMPIYKQAKQRLSANVYNDMSQRSMDETVTLSIEQTVADHKNPRIDVAAAFSRKNQNIAYHNAMGIALDSIGSSSLMAAEMEHIKPLLALSHIKDVDIDMIVNAVVHFYRTEHFLGVTGGGFIDDVVRRAPNTPITDEATLTAMYKQYKPNASDRVAKDMAGYFQRVYASNANLFTQPKDTITAATLAGNIDAFVAKKIEPIKRDVERALERGATGIEICLEDKTVRDAIPKETNRFEIAGLTLKFLYEDHVPAGVRTKIDETGKEVVSMVFALASSAIGPSGDAIEHLIKRDEHTNKGPDTNSIGALIKSTMNN